MAAKAEIYARRLTSIVDLRLAGGAMSRRRTCSGSALPVPISRVVEHLCS